MTRARVFAVSALLSLTTGCTVPELIAVVFPDNPAEAIDVARCESGLNPAAVSPGGSNHGLFQVNSVHRRSWEAHGWSWEDRFNPILNAGFAKELYDAQGWAPWACRPR